MNIKKGDTVEVIAGKDRGKQGPVAKVSPQDNRVVVQGLNQRKKHKKAQPTDGGRQTAPEIVIFDASMDASNVMLVCPKCGQPARVGHVRSEGGKAQRMCKKCKAIIDG